MLFQCWMLNMAIIGVALPGPPYISSQASIRRQRWLWGVSGRPSLFQSRRCVSLGQVLKDGGMPVSRLAFGPQVVIYAWTDCSPQSQEWCEPVPSTFAGWKKGPCTAMFATTMPVGPPCILKSLWHPDCSSLSQIFGLLAQTLNLFIQNDDPAQVLISLGIDVEACISGRWKQSKTSSIE